MSSPNPEKDRLPFEPKHKKKKTPKTQPIKEETRQANPNNIPQVVSRRMVKRMAIFSGIPTFLGMSSFFIFYLIVQTGIKIPPYAVLAVSLALFGLGVFGLTYGILSASWEEDRVGDLLGWSDFKLNFGRTYKALRSGTKENI